MSCDDCVTRREFLSKSTLAVAGAAALAAGCGDGQFGPDAVVAVTPTTGVSIKVASFPGLATVGQVVAVPPANAFIAVTRTGAASFIAFRTICTHQGCETGIQGNILVCPCHNSRYDANGRVTKQPDGGGSATNLSTFVARYDAATDTLTIT